MTHHTAAAATRPLVSAAMTLMTEMTVALDVALTTVMVVVMSLMSARVDMGPVLVTVVLSLAAV